jgi:hypothetical protein
VDGGRGTPDSAKALTRGCLEPVLARWWAVGIAAAQMNHGVALRGVAARRWCGMKPGDSGSMSCADFLDAPFEVHGSTD